MPERKFVYRYRGDYQETRGVTLTELEKRVNNSLKAHPDSLINFQVYELVPFPLEVIQETRLVTDLKVIFPKENS